VTAPEGWRQFELDHVVSFAVPADASAQDLQPIDSIFGILRGEGYEVIYDYGRFGEDLAALVDQPGYTQRSREVDGQVGDEITFSGDENPWGVVRILRVEHDRNHLTIRVSCADAETCRLADSLFDSVRFISGS
jgi:hypothetical protein